MPDQGDTDDKFVEIEGEKFKADPENLEEALKGEDGQPIPFEEKETDDQKKEREKKEEAEANEEPKVRMSAKDHIIKRLQDKKKKTKKKKDGEDDEFTPEGSEEIDRKIQEGLQPILDQVRGNSDEQELKAVLDKYPKAKEIEKKLRRYMEAYKNTPVEFIYLGLAKQMIDRKERLDKKKKDADEEALKDTTGGSTKRPKKLPKIPDISGWTNEKVLALAHKVKTGQFK